MRWQDNEAIHQDVLEREILLQDDLDPQVLQIAQQRWVDLANQAAQKQGAMVPPEAIQQGAPGAPGAPQQEQALPPSIPLPTNNPPIGGASIIQQQAMGLPEAEAAARQADILSLQQ
jgi:hypothetical protein